MPGAIGWQDGIVPGAALTLASPDESGAFRALDLRHPTCCSARVHLYEVLGDRYRTALTRTQVEQLFQAGRIGRGTPCKRIEQDVWQTIDELFPLLKYHGSGWSESRAVLCESRRTNGALVACALVAAGIAASIWVVLQAQPRRLAVRQELPIVHHVSRPIAVAPSAAASTPGTLWTGYSRPQPTLVSPPAVATLRRPVAPTQTVPAAMPTAAAMAMATPPPATYDDVVVPLDQNVVVQTGNIAVSLRIHDNDVTSFDVWVNGWERRNVKKEKGISGTRTDETLIYSAGRISVYYVWEISGKLNHCLVRVREE